LARVSLRPLRIELSLSELSCAPKAFAFFPWRLWKLSGFPIPIGSTMPPSANYHSFPDIPPIRLRRLLFSVFLLFRDFPFDPGPREIWQKKFLAVSLPTSCSVKSDSVPAPTNPAKSALPIFRRRKFQLLQLLVERDLKRWFYDT